MRMRTWDLLAELPLRIDGYRLEGLQHEGDWLRRTTVVRLDGQEACGLGEDVNYFADEQLAFQARGPALPLRGDWTLASLSDHLETLELFEGTPEYPGSRHYRRWAFDSAALDLALRQAGATAAERLGRVSQPVRFVASMSIDGEPGLDRLRGMHRARPELGFKLDATDFWSDEIVAELAAMDRVRVVDFKGAYVGTPVDQTADPALYRRVIERLPDALLEDPHRTPACDTLLAGEQHRVSWDAPIHSVSDMEALDTPPKAINIKPSRFGSLERLCDAYDHCREQQIEIYGGGQFELGPGRGQIQLLASLFHPAAANDVAPAAFNTSDDLAALPSSPLPPAAGEGFRWSGD